MTVIDLASTERPRVLHVPAYSTSAGDEAIDLAASAGLILDPWQQFVLRNALGERYDGRWSAFEVGLVVARQQGKGAVLEARELAGLVLFGEQQVVHTAHELKTSMKHFQRLVRLFDASDDLRPKVKQVINSNGKEGLKMANGAVLECLARTKNAGRGFTGDLVVLDEAYALTADQMEASMPTMLATDNAQVWYTSSPPLDAESGEILMSVRDRGESGDEDRMAWFDYGLAGSLDKLADVDLDDRANWWAALPAMRSGRVREENVLVMRKALGTDKGFAREILGIWPPKPPKGGFRLIPASAWNDAGDPDSRIDGRPAFGVYVPPDRSYSAIGAAGARVGGGRHIELTGSDQIGDDHRPGTGWIVPRLKALDKHMPSVMVIDDKAVAEEAEAAGLIVHRANVSDVVTGCQLLYDGIAGPDAEARDLHHVEQKPMTDAAACAVKRKVGNSWAWERYEITGDIAPIAAASLALFGHGTPRVHRPATLVPLVAWA
jgi:Phage Terminase